MAQMDGGLFIRIEDLREVTLGVLISRLRYIPKA